MKISPSPYCWSSMIRWFILGFPLQVGRRRGLRLTTGGIFAARQPAAAPPVYAEARAGYTLAPCGDVAQLGERRVRNAEVVSSILIVSTSYQGRRLSVGLVACVGPPTGARQRRTRWTTLLNSGCQFN